MSSEMDFGNPQITKQGAHAKNPEFIADPTEFLKHNPCTLSPEIQGGAGDGMGDTVGKAFIVSTKSTQGNIKQYLDRCNTDLSVMVMTGFPGILKIVAYPSSTQPRVAFLPYEEDKCTYTQIRNGATLFLTGPLTGCHVYVSEQVGHRPHVFHANSNASKDNVAQNKATKDNMAMNAASLAGGFKVTRRLARGEYEPGAFVFGVLENGAWEFYVHDWTIGATIKPRNRPLPRL